ncbi:PKD domain-containing protein [Lewinella sp. IMCC34183]|uniref:PKD domain-containing protein n=1 Tax=Lewinella sp. IMCC34183 TaxID=2248762 RepID=UPI000E243361|nr:PKD domain-containing protein [Lewinella sp. IMCC34183]
MANTQGFEIVSELTQTTLLNLLRAAWKSADDDSGEGVIPEMMSIPPGTSFGPYSVRAGTVQIPQDGLGLEMNVPLDGIDVLLNDVLFHVEIEDPPVESATFFDLRADLRIPTPIRALDETDVYAVFEDLAPDAVGVTITSGDPIGPITAAAVEEYIYGKFADPSFVRIIDSVPVNFPPYSMTARLELYGDPNTPGQQIGVSFPSADVIDLAIPCYLRLYNITGGSGITALKTPMGTNGTLRVTAPYGTDAAGVTAGFGSAVVALENLQPATDPTEAANYAANKNLLSFAGYDLDALIIGAFAATATSHIRTQIGDVTVPVPSLAGIEQFISQQVRSELVNRRRIFIWRPDPPTDGDVTVSDVTVAALSDALALGLNAGGGANADALVNFVPADRDFAVALSAQRVLAALEEVKCETFGSLCGPNPSAHTLDERIEGKTVRLNRLEFSLRNGSIRMEGSVTVVDALLGCIDVDATFSADAGLRWIDNADGTQRIEPFLIGDPDTDLPWYAWLLAILTGLLTIGVVGAIIGVVIVAIVENVAEKIGARVARDEVSDQLKVLSAWPQNLDNIGEVEARFLNDIGISPDGILFAGSMLITSVHALTLSSPAAGNGPYAAVGGQLVNFNGGTSVADTQVRWDFDDGQAALTRNPDHRYGKSGLYVAKHRVEVTQEGGVTTNYFAAVRVTNVAPVVQLPAELHLLEGENFRITGTFTDQNWLDTHTAEVDFGDNTRPAAASVTETHNEPQAEGEATAEHAYCDNGTYTIRLRVRDDVGAIGTATMRAIVENVAPTLELPARLNTLVDQPVRLQASFTDPGWCDTHTGEWDPGDCSPPRAAVIEQTCAAPATEGTAGIVHYYRSCGRYESRLTVADDDGATAEASQIVNVNRLVNPDFEEGFYLVPEVGRNELRVANGWRPYYAHLASITPDSESGKRIRMEAREMEVSQSRRAQAVLTEGAVIAGIMQTVRVNPGWEYEFTGAFHLPHEVSSARMRLGIHPSGTTNPKAPAVQWVSAPAGGHWRNLSTRIRATGGEITVFMGLEEWRYGMNTVFLDRARLYQIQPTDCPPPQEAPEEPTCLDFSTFEFGTTFERAFTFHDFVLSPVSGPLRIVDYGAPPEELKLAFGDKGVEITFPRATDAFSLLVNNYAGRSLEVSLLREGEVTEQRVEIVYQDAKQFIYTSPGTTGVRVAGGGNEAAVVRICLDVVPPG